MTIDFDAMMAAKDRRQSMENFQSYVGSVRDARAKDRADLARKMCKAVEVKEPDANLLQLAKSLKK